jgi:hypothetical protein
MSKWNCEVSGHIFLQRVTSLTLVRHLDADVSIQPGSNQTGNHGKDVSDRLPCVLGNALVCERQGVLSLVRVNEDA